MARDTNTNEVRHILASWVERYIACRLKEADGAELDASETAFVEAVEATAEAVPGVLENALLAYGLSGAIDAGSGTGGHAVSDEQWRLAAASVAGPQMTVADMIGLARANGADTVTLDPEWGEGPLLRILPGESIVELCYHDKLTVIVERDDGTRQVVGPFGGVFLSVAETARLHVIYQSGPDQPTLLLKRD